MFSRKSIYQIGLSAGDESLAESLFEERLTLYFVSGPGLTGWLGGGGGGHKTHQLHSWLWRMGWPRSGYCTAGFSFSRSIIVFPSLCCSGWSDQDEKFCFAPAEKLKGNSPLDSFSEIDDLITITVLTPETDRLCLNLTRFNTCQSEMGGTSLTTGIFI